MNNESSASGDSQSASAVVAAEVKPMMQQAETTSSMPAASVSPPHASPPAPPQPPATSWFLAKEMPYAMTIVLAALGWCVVRAVDTIEDSPSVKYSRSVKELSNGTFDVSFRVTNISLKTFFQGISFYVNVPDGSLSEGEAIPMPPAKAVEHDNLEPQPETENLARGESRVKAYKFYVAQLQPGSSWDFKAVLSKTTTADPQLLVDFSRVDTGSGTKTEAMPIRLIEAGLETYLVEHKVKLLVSASAVWLVIIVIFIVGVRKDVI